MEVAKLMKFILFLNVAFSSGQQTNLRFHQLGVNKKPNLLPYESFQIEYQFCISKCYFDPRCYSFSFGRNNGECNLWNVSVPHFSLAPSPGVDYFSEFRDCQDWYNYGVRTSGVYQVHWMGRMIKDVRCNMEVDGGGWLTIQRRFDGTVDFYANSYWTLFKNGFSTPYGEFWLGNDLLHEITSSGDFYFYMTAETQSGIKGTSKYGNFHIESEESLYRLHFDENLLPGGNQHSLFNEMDKKNSNGMPFSTRDKDNDGKSSGDCAENNGRGAFWHNRCSAFWLNGLYKTKQNCTTGFKWSTLDEFACLKSSEVMIKKM